MPRRIYALILPLLCLTLIAEGQNRKLLVISIDGLDHRYLKDRDSLRLRIPNLRKLVDGGSWADGVVGVVPTNTWPSHITLITGARAAEHGILDNNIQTAKGSERYWYMSYLKVPTLWDAVRKAGRTTATITWPVTVGEGITYNVPEYFERRNGGGMDLKSIEAKGTPGLIAAIAQEYPSFATEWMDDRTRALATMFLLRKHQPDLTLLHFVDHDAAAHDNGPFTREANAAIEYTDELIGQILAVLPRNTVVAIVSDHGFEAAPKDLNVAALFASKKLAMAGTTVRGGYLSTTDENVVKALREAGGDAGTCIGREIPRAEVDRFLPGTAAGVMFFEPAAGCFFGRGRADGPMIAEKAGEAGRHGHWPTRFRATFLLWGPGVEKRRLPEMDMREAVVHFARVMGVQWPMK